MYRGKNSSSTFGVLVGESEGISECSVLIICSLDCLQDHVYFLQELQL
jgi:hypothetical protein